MFKPYFEAGKARPFAIAMAAEVDSDLPLPPLVSPRNIDSYNVFGCHHPNSGAGSSANSPPMSPTDPSSEDVHILDLITKLWAVNEGPIPNHQEPKKIPSAPKPEPIKQDIRLSNRQMETVELLPYNLKVTSGAYSCWDFMDMMPLQSARLRRASPSSSSRDSITTFPHVSSDDDDDENQDEAIASGLIPETDQEKDIVRSIEMLLSDAEPGENLNQGDFEAYPLDTTFIVDREVVYFIEEIDKKSRKNLIGNNIWKFKVELIRPDASVSQLTLLPDPMGTHQGRHFCSFYPAHTGPHLLCVYVDVGSSRPDSNKEDFRQLLGSPFSIEAARCYAYFSSQNNLSRSVELQETPTSIPFCLKAWGVSVYRPYNWIFVADRDSHEIVVLDSTCKILYKFGRRGSGPGQFYRPTGISVDSVHKRVFITDKDNHRVSVFGLEGNFLLNFGREGHRNGEFRYPWGVGVSSNGQFIAVADSRNHRIQLFSPIGIFLRKFSVFEERPFDYRQEFDSPRGIAFSLDGSHIYVTDFNLQTVFVINLALTEKKALFHRGCINMNRPQGLAVDEAGNIIVTDSKHGCIHVVSPIGNRICTLNKSGKDARFDLPLDLAVLKGGRLVVVERGNRLHIL